MTKKEFENSDKPLVMIVSLNPETGSVMFDTYHHDTADAFMEEFENDFPHMLHFRKTNAAAIEFRKHKMGLKN